MTRFLRFSKILHYATFCCFFLPFFYTGCETGAEEKASLEKTKQDSIADLAVQQNTLSQDTTATKSTDTTTQNNNNSASLLNEKASIIHTDTTKSNTEIDSKTPSEKVTNTLHFLRPLLIPKENTYTGIATVIDTFPFIPFFGIFFSFLLLTISIVVKYIDTQALITIVLLDMLAFIFLLVAQPYSLDSQRLWGFWVSIIFTFFLCICDLYVIKLSKKTKTG